MGLDFTGIQDDEGAAVYCIHSGEGAQERQISDFAERLMKCCGKQVQVLNFQMREGAEVADFYDLQDEQLPAILIIRDTDEIAYSWYGADLPQVEEVGHLAEEIG